MKWFVFALFTLCRELPAADVWTWWVEPCPPVTAKETGCTATDPELAKWALATWQREAGGKITLQMSTKYEEARIRVHWAPAAGSLYGEARPIRVNGQPGAEIYVLPDTRALGRDIHRAAIEDPLFRESVVYLTCLHESGHALGLAHTADFADIMYTFRYGGDIVQYFGRYRELLKTRADIAKNAGISEADRKAIRK